MLLGILRSYPLKVFDGGIVGLYMICCFLKHGLSSLAVLNLLNEKLSISKCLRSWAEILLARVEEESSISISSTCFEVASESVHIDIIFLLSEKNFVGRNLCCVCLSLVVNLSVERCKGIDEVVVTYISIWKVVLILRRILISKFD